MKKILANILGEENVEITHIQLFCKPAFKQIVIGNSKGGIGTHCYFTGKKFARNSGHKKEISEILIDHQN
jgi:hypothetical protein